MAPRLYGTADGDALQIYSYEDITPAIGREYLNVNIVKDLMHADKADELLHELAVTISTRGVVFFRNQFDLTDDLQAQLVHRLGRLTGKPATSTHQVYPLLRKDQRESRADRVVTHIESSVLKDIHDSPSDRRRFDAALWHADSQYENKPADYTALRLTVLPKTGGDTLWASGYELFDRLSPPYQRFLEGLTATFAADGFLQLAKTHPEAYCIDAGPRGSPENVGCDLRAVHPVVRTNPVTGWKSLFALGPQPKRINELHPEESDELITKFTRMVHDNHDLTVRFKWRNAADVAIWDNRCTFHCATYDYSGERIGHRTAGIGEAPYLDPNSTSRARALETSGMEDF